MELVMQQNRLTQQERYLISFLLKEKKSILTIANKLNRDRSVIYREIKRNSLYGNYDANKAEELSRERQRLSHLSIKFTSEVRDLVVDYIKLDWSPE
jgi:IS30 family transposase